MHKLFNSLERMRFPYDIKKIPTNGIYIMFEIGETSHGVDRIVRVGTHAGENQLLKRIGTHYELGNKDKSRLQKNIGRAILCKRSDSFIGQWNLDLNRIEAKKYFLDSSVDKLADTELEVVRYIISNISFVVCEVSDRQTRYALESTILSTISLCDECRPSDKWLGLYSPKKNIRDSGLWLEYEVKESLSESDIDLLRSICG